jgi:hypothetical protein
MGEGIDEKDNSQIVKKIQDAEDVIKPEGSPRYPLEASPPSPQLEGDDVNNTKEKQLVIPVKSSASLDSSDKNKSTITANIGVNPDIPTRTILQTSLPGGHTQY